MSHVRRSLALLWVLLMVGSLSADPAQVGRLFASGRPEALKDLDLVAEATRLVEIGQPDQAEALIDQTLTLYPLHPDAFRAVDFLIRRVAEDRSVPDQDRIDAVRTACLLGVRTAQAWVDHYKTGEEAARADFKRSQYQFKSMEGSPEADTLYARELTELLDRHGDTSVAAQILLRLSELLIDTGRFQQLIDLNGKLPEKAGRVPTSLLGRAYYEVGNFPQALTRMAGEGWGSGRSSAQDWRDALARVRFAMGSAEGGMQLVRRGALTRRSSVFVDVETAWQDVPNFRRVSRDFEIPAGAEWAADVRWQFQTAYVAGTPDLIDGTPVDVNLTASLRLDPLVVPKGTTPCALSVLLPVELQTPIPYGPTVAEAEGFRTTWPLELTTTEDDWVNAPRFWARSRAGKLRNPACRIWRTCKPLGDNRVRVDIYVNTLADSVITIDNQNALVDEDQPVHFPESVQVQRKRSIQYQTTEDIRTPNRPDEPLFSYVVTTFQDAKTYLPSVTVVQRVTSTFNSSEMPPAAAWRWALAGHVLELTSPRKLWVRNASFSPSIRYQLTEILEVDK